ncbi:MAG: hypothetical protein R6X32_12335 [Chloroflexota bacterium]
MSTIDVYLEIGNKRTFACAAAWPGWCRSGRDETAALQILLDYAPHYAQVVQSTPMAFATPEDTAVFNGVERLAGNATTDFGVPEQPPAGERQPVNQAELERFQTLLQACWQAFDRAVQQATGKELRKGPRGGGRDLDKIVEHVLAADASYLRRLSWQFKRDEETDPNVELARTRQAILDALTTAVTEGLPEKGPRGGKLWLPRYFVRRVAWHVLDHTWEIEDRII